MASSRILVREKSSKKRGSSVSVVKLPPQSPVFLPKQKVKPNCNLQHIGSSACRRSKDVITTQIASTGISVFDDLILSAEEAKENEKMLSAFEEIAEYISHPEKLELVSGTQYQRLFSLMYKNLFHEIHDPPPAIIYSDVTAVYSVQFLKYLNLVHAILILILNKVNLKNIEFFFTRSFIERLVLMLRSPSQEEQFSTEKVINEIYSSVPHQKMIIYSAMAHLLEGYRDGVFTYFCVSPALRFFISFFQKTQLFNKQTFELFRTTIFALYATPFIQYFSSLLSQISMIFFSRDPLIANWCIIFLLRHWPLTASHKEVYFINQMLAICPYFRVKNNTKVAMKIIKQIGICISSNNFKVSKAALDFIKEDIFFEIFESLTQEYYQILFPRIKNASKHWSSEVRETSSSVAKLLYNMNHNLTTNIVTSMNISETQENEVRKYWSIIQDAARVIDPSLDLSES